MPKLNGTVFYDGDCSFCRRLAARGQSVLRRRGFALLPLQRTRARARLGVNARHLHTEMRVATRGGLILGGADALLYLAGFVWWATPVRWFAALPGATGFLHRAYRFFAARRQCGAGACAARSPRRWFGLLPAFLLPAIAATTAPRVAPWLLMWTMALALFAACKWLTWWDCPIPFRAQSSRRTLAYLFLWPGMDARSFIGPQKVRRIPTPREWAWAASKTVIGATLLWIVTPHVPRGQSLLAGWIGMIGLIFILHFGTFHLLALFWQRAGFSAEPLMRMPTAARSLGEFWSLRWNRGFNAVAQRYVFRPFEKRFGISGATLVTFLVSGFVHELVISLPARAGYGLPTFYFLLQGFGIIAERSALGKRAGLRGGLRGRLFTASLVAGPAYWLFHPPFVERVIVPFLGVIGAR